MKKHPHIGVFDSGVGGKSVAEAIQRSLPQATVTFVNDSQHVPYGDKAPEQVLSFVLPILQDLAEKCDVIVIACNSVTTTLISKLRQTVTTPLVGMEPMIKPAAEQTKTGVIAVCATPMTLASARYAWLKDHYAHGITVIEPDCSTWAYMIEHNQVNEESIRAQIDTLCQAHADVIVLGCTHYHWVQETIQDIARDRAIVIQPEAATIAQLRRVLTSIGY